MRIRPSARKHGIADEDIAHALRLPLAGQALRSHDPLPASFVLGPDRAGNLLEIVVVHGDDDIDIVIHAMRARPRYLALLELNGI